MTSISAQLRLPLGPVDLTEHDPRAHPGFDGGKDDGKAALEQLGAPAADLQERLFAESRTGGNRGVLLVLQGMDTSGKGGVVRHCAGLLDPQGIEIASFKAPTKDELSHDFLWRIEKRVPAPGMIGIFDRSHYEDVLIVRVRELAPADEIERRYGAINEFEKRVVDAGTGSSSASCTSRARSRANGCANGSTTRPSTGSTTPVTSTSGMKWDDYQRAYEIALERCNTEDAPWHLVPSDRKWYRNWAITDAVARAAARARPAVATGRLRRRESRRRGSRLSS